MLHDNWYDEAVLELVDNSDKHIYMRLATVVKSEDEINIQFCVTSIVRFSTQHITHLYYRLPDDFDPIGPL